jgi:chromate reductase
MSPRTVAVIVGSLRKESFSRRLALALASLAPPGLTLKIVEIRDLALYDEDVEATPPAPWVTFREQVSAADAVLFVTPEYNRSMPGALKNALDVGSRPYGHSVWSGKPAAVVSNSPGAIGGFGANHHLRQSLVFLDMPTLQQPEVYLGGVKALLGDGDGIANEGTRSFLSGFMTTFERWIEHTHRR